MSDKFLYEIDGQKGQILKLYEDRCVIVLKGGIKTLFSKNKASAEKTFYYKDLADIQLKNKTSAGSITFRYKESVPESEQHAENQFEFGAGFTTPMYGVITSQMDHVYEDILAHWKSIVADEPKQDSALASDSDVFETVESQPTISVADELLKFKQLLDMGAITQEEFDQQKEKLLRS